MVEDVIENIGVHWETTYQVQNCAKGYGIKSYVQYIIFARVSYTSSDVTIALYKNTNYNKISPEICCRSIAREICYRPIHNSTKGTLCDKLL